MLVYQEEIGCTSCTCVFVYQEKIGSLWHAAKHYETCGDICKSNSEWERLSIFYKRAADLYRAAGKGTSGDETLSH
jgi:hypothetical protein